MNLKFTFGQSAPHEHTSDPAVAATGGRALPFSVAPSSNSSELRVEVREAASADPTAAPAFEATVLSGDDVSYGRGATPVRGTAPDAASIAARSAISRALADTGEHLLSAITLVQLEVQNAAVVAAGVEAGATVILLDDALAADPDQVRDARRSADLAWALTLERGDR